MQDLVGCNALDPDADEPMKVVAYFDTLILGGAGVDALLRGAAALTGAVAGAERRGRVSRRAPDGQPAPEPAGLPRSSVRECSVGRVWLERAGEPHANDAIVLERVALALDLLEARRHPVGDLEIVLDRDRTAEERAAALARLRITPTSRIRMIATRDDGREPPTPLSTLVPTAVGILRATLSRSEAESPTTTPAGIGQWVTADRAADSWDGALVAFRVTEPEHPIMSADDFGVLLPVALACDPQHPHEDVRALARLDPRTAHFLQILVEADSLRAAAATLGMHHSTLQAKHDSLTAELGYDPRTISGRIRYGIAELYHRLTDPRVLG